LPASQELFDRSCLDIRPLRERKHDLSFSAVKPLAAEPKLSSGADDLETVAERIVATKESGASVIFMMGAHVIRAGVQNYIIDLMKRGLISCIATNGAGMIHDYELALIGATTESVARYISQGRFGLWEETGHINAHINSAYEAGLGMGQAVGKAILEGDFPYKDVSILAAGFRYRMPVTVHVGIGYDIIHQHPNCSGAATGETSYRDFLRFAKVLENLEGGVITNLGSAVMGPEVFLKALSMARNVARRQGRAIRNFTTLVCDIQNLPGDYRHEPPKDIPEYYFRPWKTMLVRTVAEGGQSFYVKADHSETIPALWSAVNTLEATVGQSC